MKDPKLEKTGLDLSRISKGIAAGATALAKAGEFLAAKKTEAVASVFGTSMGMLLAFIVCTSMDTTSSVLYASVWLTGLVGFSAGGLTSRAIGRSSTGKQIRGLQQQQLAAAQQYDRTPPSNELTRAVLLKQVTANEELLTPLRSRWHNLTPARNRRSKVNTPLLDDAKQARQQAGGARGAGDAGAGIVIDQGTVVPVAPAAVAPQAADAPAVTPLNSPADQGNARAAPFNL